MKKPFYRTLVILDIVRKTEYFTVVFLNDCIYITKMLVMWSPSVPQIIYISEVNVIK